MSLNGLDAPPVSDAYYAAIVEVGGWFLLKYTSRDEVELLARGKGGVSEARNELLKYEDKSPLYGLIVYRRRKVLIKFIPEGTSRLLQARTAVHFQTVAERYAPYETILEISNADDLSDTSLASSFPLHTASPALSTTRLDEISEDAEDGGAGGAPSAQNPPARTKSSTSAKFISPSRYKSERRVDQIMRSSQLRPASPLGLSEAVSSLPASPTSGIKSSISQFLVRDDSGTRSITSLTPSGASVTEYAGSIAESEASTTKETETMPSTAELHKVETEEQAHKSEPTTVEPVAPIEPSSIPEASPERSSEATERPLSNVGSDRLSHMPELSEHKSTPEAAKPDFDEPFDFSYLEPKPKIKLGPRPVAATPEKPRKSATMGTSQLPAGYRPAKKQEQQRPISSVPSGVPQTNGTAGMATLPVPPPIPDFPEYSPRPISRGSVKSMPSQKSSAMTPDKLRLMKAVELRKKQMRKSNPQMRTTAPAVQAPEVPKIPQHSEPEIEQSVQDDEQPTSDAPQSPKPDSGVDFEESYHAEPEVQSQEEMPSAQTEEEQVGQAPPGLLTSSVAEEDQPKDDDNKTSVEAKPDHSDETADAQQTAGAEHTVIDSQANTGLLNAQSAPIPPQDAQNDQPDHSRIETSATAPEPTSALGEAVDQSVEEPTFSTLAMEDMITGVPEIITTASSRPQTAQDPTTMHDDRSPEPSSMESSVTLESLSDKQISDLAKRRRGLVDPLYIDTRRSSVAESLSDNDFLEELQSATFHDAREMSVSKSPGAGTSLLGRNSSYGSTSSRPVSPLKEISIPRGLSQTDGEVSLDQHLWQRTDQDGPLSPDSTQFPYSDRSHLSPSGRESPISSLRRNVSSGITRRIQALNELSSRETNPVPVHIPTRTMSPDQGPVYFANDRKPSMRSPHVRTGSSLRVRPHVERIAASSGGNGFQHPDVTPVWNTTNDTTSNRDSVSVKARIVRPTTAGSAENGTDSPANLHESQIEINHLRGTPTPTAVSQAFLPPMPSVPADPPSPDHRSLHSLRRKSFGRSKTSMSGPLSPNEDARSGSASTTSIEEQSGSRTSRFFKRMSTFGSNASKRRSLVGNNATSPVIPQSDPPARSSSVVNNATAAPAVDRDTPPAVQVGDLNIQFPDTLLWKRRWLSLDESGYVHLSPPTSQQPHLSQGRPGKKFHLSDFKAPYAPDLDRQELPHSVCLEFTGAARDEEGVDSYDSGILQIACEDAMGQRHVLKLLDGYWKSWISVEPASK